MNERALNHLPRPVTFEEWGALPEDEEGELVDGVLVEEEVPTFVHEAVVALLAALFQNGLGGGRGAVGGSEAKFKVSSQRGRKPDLFVYLPGSRLPPGRARVIDLPPDIMIEVVSQRDGRYAHAVDVTSGRVEPVPGCPDLGVDVDAIWAEVERLEATNEDGQ
jgi:Uma2 family endonuclease